MTVARFLVCYLVNRFIFIHLVGSHLYLFIMQDYKNCFNKVTGIDGLGLWHDCRPHCQFFSDFTIHSDFICCSKIYENTIYVIFSYSC